MPLSIYPICCYYRPLLGLSFAIGFCYAEKARKSTYFRGISIWNFIKTAGPGSRISTHSNGCGFHSNHNINSITIFYGYNLKFFRVYIRKKPLKNFPNKMAAHVKCKATEAAALQDLQKETTKDFYSTCNLPPRWDRPYWFNGYGSQQVPLPHPFYRSTYMDYGWYPPNIHTVPLSYFPTHQGFTRNLGECGMYRNSSLNTSVDPRKPGE